MSGSSRGALLTTAMLAVVAVVAVGAAGTVTACGGASGPTGLLEGKVTLGPITPVEQAGGPPNTRPYVATIDIETAGGDVVRSVASGNGGVFTVRLKVGSYRLVPRSPEGRAFPHASPLETAVVAGRTTQVKIAYDSGIR